MSLPCHRLSSRIACGVFLALCMFRALAADATFDDFFAAIKRQSPKTTQRLLQSGADPNVTGPGGKTPLMMAVTEPAPGVVRTLIAAPATNVNAVADNGETALMLAAIKGNLDMVQALIARGANVNQKGWAPLHYAVSSAKPTHQQTDIVRLLLEQHAYIDAESPNGTTPLMMAARYGSLECVEILLAEGADPTLKNQQGLSAMDFAKDPPRQNVQDTIAAALRRHASGNKPPQW